MICIVLQFYRGDYREAMRLARFIADIEPAKRTDVRFRFVARWDCEQADRETIAHVAKRFDVSWSKTSAYKWDGWPAGPNGIAKEVIETAWSWLKQSGWTDAMDLLLLEPDCVPLSRSWLDQIIAERRQYPDALQLGSWRDSGPACGHINGNCIIKANFNALARVAVGSINQHLAWDCAIAPFVHAKWHISGLFLNHFQKFRAQADDLARPETGQRRPVMVHGYKDSSALEIAQKELL